MRAVELAGQPVALPHCLTHLHGGLAVADAKYGLNLIRLPLRASCLEFTIQRVVGCAGSDENDRVDFQIEVPPVVPPGHFPGPRSGEIVAELVEIAQGCFSRLNGGQPVIAIGSNLFLEHHPLVVRRFEREHTVFCNLGCVTNVGDFPALIGKHLGERDAYEMPFGIQHQHAPTRERLSRHDLFRRQTVRQRGVGSDYGTTTRADPVAPPMRPRGDHDAIGAVVQDVVRGHSADAQVYFDILEFAELGLPVGDDAAPLAQARQARDPFPVTAEFLLRIAKMYRVTPLPENASTLHARRASANDQYGPRVPGLLELLRVPPAPVFLPQCLVLGAHDLPNLIEFRDADVAADALANVLQSAALDLVRQKRIGNRRTSGSDEVDCFGIHQGDHVVRARKAAVPDHRDIGTEDGFSLLDERSDPTGLAKA